MQQYEYDYKGLIDTMRKEISYNNVSREPSWQEGIWWFDNMTVYIDTLNDIRTQMAEVGLITDQNHLRILLMTL